MIDFLPGLRSRKFEPDSSEAAALRSHVELAKIRIALKASPRILISGLLGVFVVLLCVSYDGAGHRFVFQPSHIAWAIACSAGIANGIAMRVRFGARPQSDEAALRTVRQVGWNAMGIGMIWGSSSWLMIPSSTFQQDAIVLVSICMVLAGAAGSQAVYGPLVRSFAIPFTTVFALGLVSRGDPIYSLLGIGYFAYCAATLHYCRNQELAIATTIELSMRNEQLLKQHVLQRREAEQAKAAAEYARAEAEAALDKAEKADRSKTSFIAAVSHDLRQPMHALVQYVGHLKRLPPGRPPAPTIEKIDKSIASMEDLLNAVLDFSKIAMGSIRPRLEAFDLQLLLKDVDTQIRPLAQTKGLALHTSASAGHVYSDRVLLERIVRNIAQNAIRYTEAGTVGLRVRRRRDFTRILVSDTGIGIRREDKDRIFDEYVQVDNAARDRSKGLGLGLAIVRDLTNLLGHRVRIKSVQGRGSVFAVEVVNAAPPVGLSSPMRHERPASGQDYVRGAVVVLVDDDAMARDGLETTLRDFGCRVLTAPSGAAAIDQLESGDGLLPQIIISDYRLANGENGVAVIARIRALCRRLYDDEAQLPALVISGDTSPVEMEHVLAADLEMIHKPVSTQRLYDAMNAGLQRRMFSDRLPGQAR